MSLLPRTALHSDSEQLLLLARKLGANCLSHMDTNIRPLQSYAAARLFHARGTTDLTIYVPD